jgi:hypothetical protein
MNPNPQSNQADMTPPAPADAPESFVDPRRRGDFQLRFYPSANGRDVSLAEVTGRNDRILIEFAGAYYEINRAYSRLLDARANPDSGQRRDEERKCLQAIEATLILRDRLEDQYAPFGVIADPVVKDGFTVDMKISFGNVDAAGKRRSEDYTITARVPIPLPGGVKFENLPIKIEGPGFNPE